MVLRAISLFSNCGAGDVGYAQAGFQFDVMAELVQRRLDVALVNHRKAVGVPGDLRTTLPDVVAAWRARHGSAPPALLAACPPCQGMSTARSGRGNERDAAAGSKDPRNLLVQVVAEAVEQLAPRLVVVENVPAFLTRRVKHPRTAEPVSAAVLLVSQLCDTYDVFPMVTNLADHGVPQSRKRAFLTFIRKGEPRLQTLLTRALVPYPAATHAESHVPLGTALRSMGLPSLDASDASSASDSSRPLHAVPVWDRRRYLMASSIPVDSGRTAWQNDVCVECGPVDVADEDLRCPTCRTPLPRPIVQDGEHLRFVSGFRRSSYARMHPNQPAATVTTASGRIGSDNTIHPWENRLLSTLECALLQTFPGTFRWGDALTKAGHTSLRAMIGEAVPPMFTRQHGRVLSSILNNRRPYSFMAMDDAAVTRAASALARLPREASPSTLQQQT